MLNVSDEELVTRAKRELPTITRSYEILVERHMNRIYNQAYRVLGHQQEAEDVTQEVLVKVYHSLPKFEQQASFSSWLFRITANTSLNALAKNKRHALASASKVSSRFPAQTTQETDPLDSHPSPLPGPEQRVISAELRDCIRQVLKKLEREQANLLVMCDIDDMSYAEIAQTIGVGLGAIKMRIQRGRLAFQELFNRICGEPDQSATPTASVSSKARPKAATKAPATVFNLRKVKDDDV